MDLKHNFIKEFTTTSFDDSEYGTINSLMMLKVMMLMMKATAIANGYTVKAAQFLSTFHVNLLNLLNNQVR